MADPIKFVFIATADDAAFEDAATARTKELCSDFYDSRLNASGPLPAPAILRFVHFRNNTDEVRVFEFTLGTGATPKPPPKITWKSLASFVASGDAKFSPATFVDSGTPLDIKNLYHSVRGAPPGSVLELSIYSHGWTEGPLLRSHSSSNDDNPPAAISGLPMRNPSDTDGRARTDFEDNMGEDPTVGSAAGVFPRTGGKGALAEFKAAFDKNAKFLICGCNGQDPIRDSNNVHIATLKATATQLINQAYTLPTRANENEKTKKTKSAAATLGAVLAKNTIPTNPIDIDMGAEFADELRDIQAGGHYTQFDTVDLQADKNRRLELHYELDTKFFPAVNRTNGAVDNQQVTKFQRDFTQVQGAVARRMQQMYGFKAASKLGIKILAGPVGVKSSVIPDKQMQVCGVKNAKPSECERALGFHEKFMGLTKDKRNYFVFDQQAVGHINDLAKK
jgi:hypothetical protein